MKKYLIKSGVFVAVWIALAAMFDVVTNHTIPWYAVPTGYAIGSIANIASLLVGK